MQVKVRPKGLGLGADRSVLEKASKSVAQSNKEGEEQLKVIVGAFVQLLSGKHQGLYGQVFIQIILLLICQVYNFLISID